MLPTAGGMGLIPGWETKIPWLEFGLQLQIPPAGDVTRQRIMLEPYCCERQPLQCDQKEKKTKTGSSPSDPLRGPFCLRPASLTLFWPF